MRDRGTQDHLLTLFTDGLYDARVKRHIIRNRPDNLEAALTNSIKETDILNKLDARSKSPNPNMENITGVGVINNSQTQSDAPRSQTPRQSRLTNSYGGRPNMVQRNQFSPLPRCWICNETHILCATVHKTFKIDRAQTCIIHSALIISSADLLRIISIRAGL